jgi:hypothetical protein
MALKESGTDHKCKQLMDGSEDCLVTFRVICLVQDIYVSMTVLHDWDQPHLPFPLLTFDDILDEEVSKVLLNNLISSDPLL